MSVEEKLDQLLWGDMTVRKFIQEIYNKALSDRQDAKKLFDDIFDRYKKLNENREEEKKINPAEELTIPVSTYMKLMKQSNDQLIEVCKIIERIINFKAGNFSGNTVPDGTEPSGEYSSALTAIMNEN